MIYTVQQKNSIEGLEILPVLEELDPGLDGSILTASLYTEWGRLLANLNRVAEAETQFRAVVDNYPDNIHARTELGRLLAKQKGRENEAERYLLDAVRIHPNSIQSRTEMGRLLAKQPGRELEAEIFLRENIQCDPKGSSSFTELGRLLSKQPGREKEAEQFLREVFSFDPNNIQARTELGRLLAKQEGREAEAEQLLREAIYIAPRNLYPHTELGRLLAKQEGREAEAEQYLREVIQIDPKNIPARTLLMQIYLRAHQEIEAEQIRQEILHIDPNYQMGIFSQTPKLIQKVLTDESHDDVPHPLNELKVVFLGDGEAGKSLTIARLMHDGTIPDDFDGNATPGIAISSRTYPVGNDTVHIHFWDFGGQEILHSVHRMFLTGRTLYVILVSARDGTENERAIYWLNNLKSFAKGAPALLVINKIDQNSHEINEGYIRGSHDSYRTPESSSRVEQEEILM